MPSRFLRYIDRLLFELLTIFLLGGLFGAVLGIPSSLSSTNDEAPTSVVFWLLYIPCVLSMIAVSVGVFLLKRGASSAQREEFWTFVIASFAWTGLSVYAMSEKQYGMGILNASMVVLSILCILKRRLESRQEEGETTRTLLMDEDHISGGDEELGAAYAQIV